MKNFKFEHRVQYYETDKMGIVHHSNYVRWFEEARIVLMEEMGIPYKELENNNLMIPVLNVYCEYKKPVTFGDVVVITPMLEFLGVRMVVNYTIEKKETKELIAIGETKHCITDQNMKPVALKKANPEIYEKFVAWLKK